MKDQKQNNQSSKELEEQEMNLQDSAATPSEAQSDETMTNDKADSASEETKEPTAEDTIAELSEKCADLADKNLRMMAEFDNYRRRTSREKLELQKTAGESIFRDMLPLIDDFERAQDAMTKTDDINAVRDGIKLIYQKFMTFLEKNDVRPIETEDMKFDTAFHEAITTFPAPTPEQKGMIIDCTQRGYTLGDKVIRYAKVVVGE